MNFGCLSLYSPNDPYMGPPVSNCWKPHTGVTNDASTFEEFLSGLLHGVRMTPLQPLHTPTTLIYMSTHCNWAVISAEWYSSTHSMLLFITPTGVKCVLHINNGLWNEHELTTWKVFSGVYGKWRCPRKSIFTATGGLTHIPLVLLRHSVGVVGQ